MKIHPNSRTAWMLVMMTVIMSAGVVAFANFMADDGRILFTHFDGTDYEIFVMDANGENLTQLTNNSVDDWAAAWSPNGNLVAFRSLRNGTPQIFVMNADGSDAYAVTPTFLYAGYNGVVGLPAWSPDGSQIAFEGYEYADYNIYVVTLADGALSQITNSPFNDMHPNWSPDGSRIAYASETRGEGCAYDCDIFVMNADGSNSQRYTFTEGMDVYPAWSPDGSQILFHSERNSVYGESDIYLMNADGSNQHVVVANQGLDRVGRWSPDGDSIVFRSERDGDSDIYVFNLETGATTAVSHDYDDDRYPDWK
jgi:Tol biopolymer transport system component